MRFIFLLVLAQSAMAQTATLTGQVTDPSGAVVPGAVVLVTHAEDVRKISAGANGDYAVAGLAPGDYQVSASAAQLTMPKPLSVTLRAGSATTLNLRLNVSGATQQVTVTSDAGPEISTEASANASATVLRGDDLEALADDPDDLQADLEALAGPSAGPGGSAIFVDGFSGGQLPPKASIREVRVNSNPFSPEYDQLGYGRIEIFTKPGTDKFHGNLGYNLGTDKWNSRNPYSALKAPLLLNEFENDISGRLSGRASFTLVLERQMVDNGSITNAVTLDPNTLATVPIADFVTTPQRRFAISPKIDVQLSQNNTFAFRWNRTASNVKDFGIGGFELASRGRQGERIYQLFQTTETYVHGSTVNEVRFQFMRHDSSYTANTSAPALLVSGAFNGGGASATQSSDLYDSSELHDYVSLVRGRHFWRSGVRLRWMSEDSNLPSNFNGTFSFAGGNAPQLDAANRPLLDATGQPLLVRISSLEQYRRTLLFQKQGLPAAQIRALGGGASQFSMAAGQADFTARQKDVGLFVGDDWKVRPNLTLNLGVRYEGQTNIHDRSNFAPRLARAWAPGSTAKKQGKTVIRAGVGFFYERFSLGYTLSALRYADNKQLHYTIPQPDFFPTIPSVASLSGNLTTQTSLLVDSHLQIPLIQQAAVTLERQLPMNTTFAVTYTTTHQSHEYRSTAINAPSAGSGVLPFPGRGPIFLIGSSGIYNQNQVRSNFNTKVNSNVSMFGNYSWSKAMSSSDGVGTYPANPANYAGEYAPAAGDIRHRGQLGGTLTMRWNIRLNPLFTIQSGAPFNITTGQDTYLTTLYNARPGVVSSLGKAGVIQTPYGFLDPNPVPGETILGRNAGRGPKIVSFNLKASRTWKFGRPEEAGAAPGSMSSGPGGIFGGVSPARRYSLTAAMSARNILNRNNPGAIVGNLSSPLFGRANEMFGATNGEGFSENANNRRLELQLRLSW